MPSFTSGEVTAIIVSSIVGGIALLIGCFVLVEYCRKRRREQTYAVTAAAATAAGGVGISTASSPPKATSSPEPPPQRLPAVASRTKSVELTPACDAAPAAAAVGVETRAELPRVVDEAAPMPSPTSGGKPPLAGPHPLTPPMVPAVAAADASLRRVQSLHEHAAERRALRRAASNGSIVGGPQAAACRQGSAASLARSGSSSVSKQPSASFRGSPSVSRSWDSSSGSFNGTLTSSGGSMRKKLTLIDPVGPPRPDPVPDTPEEEDQSYQRAALLALLAEGGGADGTQQQQQQAASSESFDVSFMAEPPQSRPVVLSTPSSS